jgi:hypothetical protein
MGWSGWLASPGDAVLSAVALLVAAVVATRSLAIAPHPRAARGAVSSASSASRSAPSASSCG